jgi:hypothetical protein
MIFPVLPFLISLAAAHGIHTPQVDPSEPWALRHLASEHHIHNYDAGAFFHLHDFDGNGALSRDEVMRLYGLRSLPSWPPSEGHKSEDEIWNTLSSLIGVNSDGDIGLAQWMNWRGELPDFGTGPGHHGDDEWEYEIHHFEQYHSEDKEDGSDMVMHAEDVEHVSLYRREESGIKADGCSSTIMNRRRCWRRKKRWRRQIRSILPTFRRNSECRSSWW